jgi:hypothetical protein
MSASFSLSIQSVFVPAKSPAKISSWKTIYENTIWELDAKKLLALIHATEAALYLRWQELSNGPENTGERAAMKAAAKELLAIKLHKLGWPDPCR